MKLPLGALFSSPRSAQRVVNIPTPGAWDIFAGSGQLNKKLIKSPWFFACADIRGSELAGLPWGLVDKNGTDVLTHPLIDMIENFGVEANRFEAMRALEIDMLLGAREYWLRDADILQRLDPETIKVKKDRTGIQGFEQVIDGRLVNRFDRDEIVYFREFNPNNQLEPGPSVYQIVEQAIKIEVESGLYVEAFFKNDATPSFLVSTDADVQQGALEEIRDWWNKTFRGSRQAHKTAFLSKGFKATPLSTSMKDTAIVELRTRAQNDICAGTRVPSILVANMVDATYANASEARKFCLEDVVIPRSKFYAGVINADLIHKVDPKVFLRFFPERLPILQEAEWKKMYEAVQAGVISSEFARTRMGWPETAAPAQAPETPQDDEGRALGAWRRKATKAIKAGRPADVDFETDDLPPVMQAAIRARLVSAKTIAEVDRAFTDD
jgi:HK97 family phage portal protein